MKKVLIIGFIVIVIVAGGLYAFMQFGVRQRAAAQASLQTVSVEKGSLQAIVGASGSVRSNQTARLAWQTSGTVGEVKVAVGDQVSKGQELATLAQSSLPQNIILSRADLANAQKALDDLMNSKLQQAQALQTVEDAQRALDDLLNPQVSQARAQQAIANAQKAVEEATRQLRNSQTTASQSSIDQANAQVAIAKDRLDKAKANYAPYANKPENNLTRASLLSQMAAAQQQYDAAVRNLNSMLGTAGPTDQAILQANLENAKAQLAQAQLDWERLKNGPSQSEIALAEARLADAQRNWESLKNGPNPDDIAAAQARVAAAQASLNQAHITAPFTGTITLVDSQTGDQVSPGALAFRLDDLSRLLVDVQVSEVDINQIQLEQPVILTFDSILGQEYHGKVVDVASVGQSDQGVVNFTVTVELSDAGQYSAANDGRVKPGMSASVTIVISELNDVLLVPNRAVRSVDGKLVVYVLRNGVSTAVNVTLGKTSDTQSEVLSGDLSVGDLIILNPPTNLLQGGSMGRPGGGNPFGGGSTSGGVTP